MSKEVLVKLEVTVRLPKAYYEAVSIEQLVDEMSGPEVEEVKLIKVIE